MKPAFKIPVFVLLLSFFIGNHTYAQTEKSKFECSLGYGFLSSDQLFDSYFSYYTADNLRHTYSMETYTGPISFTARYMLSRKFSIGITMAYENETGDWLAVIDNGGYNDYTTQGIGWFKRRAYTVAPEGSFTYKEIHGGLVKFYCVLGIGATYQNEVDAYSEAYYLSHYNNGVNSLGNELQFNNNRTHFNMQVAQGIRFGRKVGGFVEAGIGYKGLINAGLSIKL